MNIIIIKKHETKQLEIPFLNQSPNYFGSTTKSKTRFVTSIKKVKVREFIFLLDSQKRRRIRIGIRLSFYKRN